jgi:hypothetical protein
MEFKLSDVAHDKGTVCCETLPVETTDVYLYIKLFWSHDNNWHHQFPEICEITDKLLIHRQIQ